MMENRALRNLPDGDIPQETKEVRERKKQFFIFQQ
jgi:hypothetical protein